MSGAAGTPFSGFVQLMERITQERGAKRKDLLTTFFKAYGWGDFYPVYRLLLPALDKERRSYQMKEAAIAKLYVEALAIDNNSEAGQVSLLCAKRRNLNLLCRSVCSSIASRRRSSGRAETLARQCTWLWREGFPPSQPLQWLR